MAFLFLSCPAARAGTYSTPTYSGGQGETTYTNPPETSSAPDAPNSDAEWGCIGGGSASSYAPSPASSLTVSATGTITATFTWQPAYPGEPAPASVILQQHCLASWSGNLSGTATVTGDCDNGLGGPVVSHWEEGSCESVKYMVQAPEADGSVTVTCLPSAHLSGDTGSEGETGGIVRVSYSATITPVTINLTGQNSTNQALTGQQITATLSTPNGLPSGTKITSYTWSFDSGVVDKPAKPIKNWDETASGDPTHPQLVPLTAADLTATDTSGNGISVNSVSFYDEVQENVTVKCVVSLKFSDGTTATVNAKSVPVAFLKPNVSKWMIDTGYIQPLATAGYFGLNSPPSVNPSVGGEYWHDVTIDVPQPFSGGQGCFAQLITPGFEMYQDGSTIPVADPNDKKQGLDNAFPYQGYMWNLSTSGNTPALGTQSDSPSIGLAAVNVPQYQGWNTAVRNDSFITWVMYRPPVVGTQGHIWVPLENYSWSVSFTLQWLNNQWAMTASSPSDTKRAAPRSPADVDSPPSWSLIQTNSSHH